MAGQLIVVGLGLAALGYAGRHALKTVPSISEKVMKQLRMIEMNEAHKRIMALNHPDRGGSPLLASKINEARDLLDDGDNRML
ncbi:Mitochondrial import inner membrane translocase subunit TIM14 [Blattella germanica]|nr:Mitochondrial import inner membrane translocase subunit TIM14 [Blattella germanica]